MNPTEYQFFEMSEQDLYQIAQSTGLMLQKSDMQLVTAESCTGGWVAKVMTDVPGSSSWFERGFVTYTNESKQELLGVPAEVLTQFGAVSEQVVDAMARGALANSRATIAVAISGIAGPGGGSEEKPVGTVCFAWHLKQGANKSERKLFSGDREQIRAQAVSHALKGVNALVQSNT